MEVTECGVACLAMVLAWHGRWIALEQLRAACGVSSAGTRADTLIRAARRFGLACSAFRAEPSQLSRVPMPCILHWDFNHFVVLEGLTSRYAWLNDPAVGRRRIEMTELEESFTGVVLALRPNTEFERAGRKPDFYGYLLRQLQHSRRAAGLLVAISVALIVPGILVPVYSRIFIDDVLVGANRGWLRPLLLGLGATALLRGLCMILQKSLSLRLQRKIAVTLMSRVLWQVLSLPLEFFSQRSCADLVSRISAGEQLSGLLANGLAVNVLNLVEAAFFAVTMSLYDPALAAVCLAISSVNLVAATVLGKRHQDASRSLAAYRGELFSCTSAQIRGLEPSLANGVEEHMFAGWAGYQARYLNKQREAGLYATLLSMVPPVTTALATAAILGLGALQVMQGRLTLGGLVAFQSLMMSFAAPINNLVQLGPGIQAAKGNVLRLLDIFNHAADPRAPGAVGTRPGTTKLSGRIEIRDLSFGYASLEPALLVGLSLELAPGMRIALVGSSGSGKSTLARLICGLYRPWSGEIRFDGKRLEQISAEAFAASVAYVDQDVRLFEGTLRENLTLWNPGVSDAALRRALQDAQLHQVIASRPGHVDCRVDEGGTNFSGGERLRIEIARALVNDPTILILDEATAALDTLTEKLIDENLRRRGCTCIIVAHRLSTVRDCDEIVVLEKGKVLERGTHDELLPRCGRYTQLVTQE